MYQPKKGYRFSLDAPLLAALTPIAAGISVLDFGCGSGVLPLLLMGRETSLRVFGMELRQKPYELALFNMKANGVDVPVIHGDVMEATSFFAQGTFDLIVSNPPYYPVGACRLPCDEDVAAAKTELYWHPRRMLEQARLLLNENGRFALIFDAVREEELLRLGKDVGFYPVSCRRIFTKETDVKPKRVYLLLSKSAVSFSTEPPLILYEKTGEMTSEMKRILKIYHGTGAVSCGDSHR